METLDECVAATVLIENDVVCKYYHLAFSTGALEFGLEKKCRKLIFSGYISGLPLIENLMSPQKSPLRVLHIN